MKSSFVDRDLFEEVESENIKLISGEEDKDKYSSLKQSKFWYLVYRTIGMLENFVTNQFFSPVSAYIRRSRHFLTYNFREILKRKVGYCLGMLSCVLVVIAITNTITVSQQLPIIFLRLGENTIGQFDLRTASDRDYGYTLNFTHLEEGLEHHSLSEENRELFSLMSPRIVYYVTYFGQKYCEGNPPIWNHEDIQWTYGYGNNSISVCIGEWGQRVDCPPITCGRRDNGRLIAFDHKREEEMGFGRQWDHERLKPGECIISENLAGDLEVEVGDELIVQTRMISSAKLGWLQDSGFLEEEEENPDIEVNWRYIWWYVKDHQIYFPLKIVALERTFQGKNDHERMGKDIAYVDYGTLFEHIGNYVDQEFWDIRPSLRSASPYHYATEVHVNHPDRINDLYSTNNYQKLVNRVTKFAGEFLYLSGFDQLESYYPLLGFLGNTQMITLFLSLIINIIIAILVCLSIILIYSLLMINVEERTFEMGILRMVGLNLRGLVEMILLQSLLYSIPGIILGLAVGQGIYTILAYILQRLLKSSLTFRVSTRSVLLAILMGLAIPFAGSIIPIRKAMGKSLNESLDTKRSKAKAIKIKIERLTDRRISWSVVIISGGAFGFGFFIYYFFPLAMITQQFELLLSLFFGIILMMLIGCVLLSLNIEGIIQTLLTKIILFWEFASVKKLVLKNLVAHKTRNRKTTIMYSISLGFLIFIAVSTRLEIKMYEFTQYRIYGTELVIDYGYGRERSKDLNNPNFLADLDRMVENFDILEDYAYVSIPLSNLVNYTQFYFQTMGGYWTEGTDIQAMSPNFFEVMDDEYLIASRDKKEYRGWGIAEQLYTDKGFMGFMGGHGEYKNMAVSGSLDDNVVYTMEKPTEQYNIYTHFLMRYDSVLESGAGTTFSKYDESVIVSRLDNGKNGHDAFVSFPSFLKFLETENVFRRVEDIPIRYIYLKTKKSVGKGRDRDQMLWILKRRIKRSMRQNNVVGYITDVNEFLDRIKVIDSVLSVFFYLSTTLAMTMCFFSLVANMFTNVQEQSKEIGILRSLGCRKCTLRRVYVYEALILIYTAGVIGTVIGMFIGYTLVLQQQLFTQLPLTFVVPYEIIIIVIVSGIVCGFFASICPINCLLRNNPVMIMRRVF